MSNYDEWWDYEMEQDAMHYLTESEEEDTET